MSGNNKRLNPKGIIGSKIGGRGGHVEGSFSIPMYDHDKVEEVIAPAYTDLFIRNCTEPMLKTSDGWWDARHWGTFFQELGSAFIFSLVLAVSTIKFTPASSLEGTHALARAGIIGLTVLFLKAFVGRNTSAFFGPWRIIGNFITFAFVRWQGLYARPNSTLSSSTYFWEFVKVLLFCLMGMLGTYSGVATASFLFRDVVTGDITTTDCSITFVPACPATITNPGGFGVLALTNRTISSIVDITTDEGLYFAAFLSTVFIYGVYAYSERYFGWGHPGSLYSAFAVASAYAIVHGLFSSALVSVDFWYWVVTSTFVKTFPQPSIYVGMVVAGVFCVVFFDLLNIWVNNGIKSRENAEGTSKLL